ncbi:MAG: caspase family protein [Bacteroidales bacterium]|nr:caspase family protein [Bacteroidales bacterium]
MRTNANFIKNSKYVVLLIGVSRYENARGLHDIPNVEANIRQMYNLFLDKRLIGVNEKNIIVSINESAIAINKKLTDASEKAKNSDYTLFVYYSGHGIISPSNYNLYFATSDVEDKYLEDSAINAKGLLDKLNRSVASRKILVVDACHSGQIHNTMGDVNSTVAGLMNNYEGVHYVSACDEASSALFNKRKPEEPTYFTGAIIDRVRKGMDMDKPYITLRDIVDDIRDEFKGRKNMPIPQQSSMLNADQMPFAMNVAASGNSVMEYFDNFSQSKVADTKVIMQNCDKNYSKTDKNGNAFACDNETKNAKTMRDATTININSEKSVITKYMFLALGITMAFMLVFSSKVNAPMHGNDHDNALVITKINDDNFSDTSKKVAVKNTIPVKGSLTSPEFVDNSNEKKADELLEKGGEQYFAIALSLYEKSLSESENAEVRRKANDLRNTIAVLYNKYMEQAQIFAETESKEGMLDAIDRVEKALEIKPNDSVALDMLADFQVKVKTL